MFELDVRNRKPIYEQLVDKFKELIISEVLKQDEQLPSVRTLAQQMTINPNTIQKAYRELENQGYTYSIVGKGSFVNPSSHTFTSEKLTNIKQALEKLLAEAFYLGMTGGEIHQLIANIEKSIGGEKTDD